MADWLSAYTPVDTPDQTDDEPVRKAVPADNDWLSKYQPVDKELTPPTDEGTNPTNAKYAAATIPPINDPDPTIGADVDRILAGPHLPLPPMQRISGPNGEPFDESAAKDSFKPVQWAAKEAPSSTAKDLALDVANPIATTMASVPQAPSVIGNALFGNQVDSSTTAKQRRVMTAEAQGQMDSLAQALKQIPPDDPNADPRQNAALEDQRQKLSLGMALAKAKMDKINGSVEENWLQAGMGENARAAAKDYDFINQVTQSNPETQGNKASQLARGIGEAAVAVPALLQPEIGIPALTASGMSKTALESMNKGDNPAALQTATLGEGIKQLATLSPFAKGAALGNRALEAALPESMSPAARFGVRTAGNTAINEGLTAGINAGQNAVTGEENPAWSIGSLPTSLGLALLHAKGAKQGDISNALRPEGEKPTIPVGEKVPTQEGTASPEANAAGQPAGGKVPLSDSVTPGPRNVSTPESLEYQQNGGWKLHLTVDPSNYKAVDGWLQKNHPGQYKLLGGGDQGEKDFTVYVGDKSKADSLAEKAHNEIGDLLQPSNVGNEDTSFGPKVAGRFDLSGRGGFRYYGRDGLPYDQQAKDAEYNLVQARKTGNPQQISAWENEVSQNEARIKAQLEQRYGARFSGQNTATPESDFPAQVQAFRDGKSSTLVVPKGEEVPGFVSRNDNFEVKETADGNKIVYPKGDEAAASAAEKGLEPAGGEPQNPPTNEPAAETPFQPQGNTVGERIAEFEEWKKQQEAIRQAFNDNQENNGTPVSESRGQVLSGSGEADQPSSGNDRLHPRGEDNAQTGNRPGEGDAGGVQPGGSGSPSGIRSSGAVEAIHDFGRRVYKAGMDFKTWSGEMVRHLGENVRQYLGDAWKKIQDHFGRLPGRGKLGGAKSLFGGEREKPIEVFHGTPHVWEGNKFDVNRIGTGEGHASFGWGANLAEARGTAEHYKKTLTTKDRDWRSESGATLPKDLAYNLGFFDKQGKQFVRPVLDNARRYYSGQLSDAQADLRRGVGGENRVEYFQRILNGLDAAERGEKFAPREGSLYRAEVHAHPDELLDWDKPLHEQSPQVKAVLERMGYSPDEAPAGLITGERLYRNLEERLGSDRAASEKLAEEGIPGHKYLDQLSRGESENPTHNLIMYSGERINPTHLNDLPLEKHASIIRRIMGNEGGGVGVTGKQGKGQAERLAEGQRIKEAANKAAQEKKAIKETKAELPRKYDVGQNQAQIAGQQVKNQIDLALKESVDRTKGFNPTAKAHNEDLDRRAASFVEEAGGSKEQYERDVNELKNQTSANLRSNDPAIRTKAQAVQKWLNKGGNEVLAHGQEHFDRIHQAIEPYREVMKQQRQAEINNGIKIGDRDNYVSHLFHHEEGTMFGGGGGQGSRYFTKKGNFKTLLEGLTAGYIPKTTDLAELAQNRVASGQKMVAERQWVDSLHDMKGTDGNPLIRPVEGKAEGYDAAGNPLPDSKNYKQILLGGQPVMVDRKFSRVIENLTKSSALREYAAGRLALKGAAGVKHVMLAMDTFHASRMAQKGAAQGQFGYQKPLSILEYRPEDLAAAVRQGDLTQAEADYARQNHAKAMFLIEHGLNVGQISDNIMHLLSTKIPVISTFNNWTFQKMTRGIMLGSAMKNFDRTMKAHPEWSREKVAQFVSKETNENFGSLGNQGLVTSKTIRDAMRVAFLAPQWVESQVRAEGRTYGQLAKGATGQGIGNLGRGAVIGVGSYFALAQLINHATRGKPTWDNEEPGHFMDAYIPTGGKTGMWFDPKSTFLEYLHSLSGNYAKTAGGGLGLKEAAQQVIKNKLGPMVQAEERFRTGQNWKGEKDRSLLETAKGTLAEVAPLPINLSQVYDKTKAAKQGVMAGFKNPIGDQNSLADALRQGASSAGVKMDRALTPRENMFRAASPYRSDSGYHGPPSPYRDLDRALSSGDLKAAASEIKRLQADRVEQKASGGDKSKVMASIDKHYGLQPNGTTRDLTPELYTGAKESEARFKAGFTPFDRKQYEAAQKDRQTAAQLYARAKAMAGVQ